MITLDNISNLETLDDLRPSTHNPGRVALDHSMHGRLQTAEAAMQFMLAGKATVTFQGRKSRFTYKLRASEDGNLTFVSVLNGPDNWANYAYLGYIRRGIYHHGGRKAKVGYEAPSAKAFAWTFQKLAQGLMPEGLEIWHEGKCGRCGRKLTVPESIASGFGPECVQHIH